MMGNDNEISTRIDKALAVWMAEGIKLQTGASASKIADCEKLLDFKFPQYFIELYLIADGFEDFDWNANMFSLWSLDRIIEEYKENNDNSYVGFCDFLINSHTIGFSKTGEGIFKNYYPVINNYNLEQPIENTFKGVIELINVNSDLLY